MNGFGYGYAKFGVFLLSLDYVGNNDGTYDSYSSVFEEIGHQFRKVKNSLL